MSGGSAATQTKHCHGDTEKEKGGTDISATWALKFIFVRGCDLNTACDLLHHSNGLDNNHSGLGEEGIGASFFIYLPLFFLF